jgi:hypothetical protein
MIRLLRQLFDMALVASLAILAACGGGGSASSGGGGGGGGSPNVVPLVVDTGPSGSTSSSVNQAFVTITVCPPGSTSNCQTIDHVWVDTGSSGLRLMASVLTAPLLPSTAGTSLANCAQFVSNSTWGAVRVADVTIGGKTAMSVPIQVMSDTSVPATPPTTCSSSGSLISTVSALGANGLLGVGLFKYDCGTACAGNSPPTGFYYSCPGGVCSSTIPSVPLAGQLQNIANLFQTNGVLIQLPALSSATGQASATGTLTFGFSSIDSSAQVFPTDNNGFIGTTFGGLPQSPSFVDSGSNGWFFDDPLLTKCTGALLGFYCSSRNESATMTGITGTPSFTYSFRIANATTLNVAFAAFDNLGGPSGLGNFDWGLPFFYGRSVYTVIEGNVIGGNTGPFVAATTP